ncbi:MAG: glycoside hydrolase family 2 TIM barrel-domain containing protein [Ignavibacteriota bacterium]|nr:hypothetical protein [Ignavibacteriota bacterium]
MINKFSLFILLFVQLLVANISFSQVKIYERSNSDKRNSETITDSEKRLKIDLNGAWNISIDNGSSANVNIPFAADTKSSISLKRDLKLSDSLVNNYNFIFYAEGINYYSEVKINDVIVSRNNGGCKLISSEIQENLVLSQNSISIRIENELNNTSTFPLSSQVNYAKNYAGVISDIYLIAVPKIYISETLINYTFENDNVIQLTNRININTLNIDNIIAEDNSFNIKTEIFRKSDTAKVFESSLSRFDVKSYQSYKAVNNIAIKGIDLWKPDNPKLYIIRTHLFHKDVLIDDIICETGFRKIKIAGSDLYVNDSKYKLNGINYSEDQPKFASALDYAETEKDLLKIKDIGFNCIRVPGKSANPIVIKIAQRIGLFVLQEFPFNNIPKSLLGDEKYVKEAIEYFENIVKRDKNSPAILFWGIGNDFDVTSAESESYANKIKESASQLDNRPLYYTSRNLDEDKVSKIIGIKGFNIIDNNLNEAKSKIEKIGTNSFNFISGFGVSVDNNNRNGFGDIRSIEYQAKFLTDLYKVALNLSGTFMNSYADYNAESPIVIQHSADNPFLNTNGIFDFNRNPKYTSGILKRMLNNQGFQKIPEGNETFSYQNSSYFFIVIGLSLLILLILTSGKIRNFKDNLWKSLFTSKNFLYVIKEQNSISGLQNFLLLFYLSTSIGLFFSTIIYHLRTDTDFNFIVSKTIDSSGLLLIFYSFINNPFLLFFILSIVWVLLFTFVYLFMNFCLKIVKKNIKLRPALSVYSWSFIGFLIFLIIGIIFSKLLTGSSSFISLSIYLYFAVLLYSLFKLLNGLRYVFDLGIIKSFIYGTFIFLILFSINYYYFVFYKSLNIFVSLIKSYN